MIATTARSGRPAHAGGNGPLTGTGTLVRLVLRRDRIRLPVWIGALTLQVVGSAALFPEVYPTRAARQARAELLSTPAARAVAGPGYGLDDYTYGAMTTEELLGFTAIFVALMSLLLIARHTRAEEQHGRAVLVRSAATGRLAPMAAALLVAAAANLVVGGLVASGLMALGIDSIDRSGSVLFGAALAAVGITFAGIAAVTAQLSHHARGAAAMAGGALAVAYLLRAAGDMTDGTLSWLSPIGWAQATAAYVHDRWWPLLFNVGLAVLLVAAALLLDSRRDVGAALVPPRAGPAHASPALRGTLGLAVRLQRANVTAWALALLAFGLGYGSLITEVEAFVADNQQLQKAFALGEGVELVDAFVATIASLLATLVAVPAVQATLRLRGEEAEGHADAVLGAAVGRSRWLASHLVVAIVGAPAVLLLGVIGLGVTASVAADEPRLLMQLIGAGLAHVPALWLICGLAVALFGVAPRRVGLVWVVVGYALFVGMFGGLLGLPDWAANVSPFGVVPLLPVEELTIAPLAVLITMASGFVAIGVAGFRRRDLRPEMG